MQGFEGGFLGYLIFTVSLGGVDGMCYIVCPFCIRHFLIKALLHMYWNE